MHKARKNTFIAIGGYPTPSRAGKRALRAVQGVCKASALGGDEPTAGSTGEVVS